MDFFIFSLIAIMWNSCLLWLLANEHALIVALGDGNKQVWSEDYITNYLLISLARAVLGNIGPRSFFVRTERTTTGQYSSVRPLHSVSKRLIFLLQGKRGREKRRQVVKLLVFAWNVTLVVSKVKKKGAKLQWLSKTITIPICVFN